MTNCKSVRDFSPLKTSENLMHDFLRYSGGRKPLAQMGLRGWTCSREP